MTPNPGTGLLRFEGQKNPLKRMIAQLAARPGADTNGKDPRVGSWAEYRKKTTIFAAPITVPFEVNTIEGLHTAKAGDYIAVGIEGELYPIDADVFSKSYEEVPRP